MPFELMANRLGRLAERETRSIIVLPELPDRSLPEGVYTLHEMYCNERGCDCRRVFLNIQASFRPGPEAVVAWGAGSRARSTPAGCARPTRPRSTTSSAPR